MSISHRPNSYLAAYHAQLVWVDWLLESMPLARLMERLRIPHVARFSLGKTRRPTEVWYKVVARVFF
jgi:hypothetical protein